MVARTPPRQRNMLTILNPVQIRETLNKVDQCMVRLQELQFTVAGGTKTVSGVNLSPRSTRTYLRTSLRCKQESMRIKNAASKTSPLEKFPKPANLGGEWRQMSLPAMLVGETVVEILQASQFAREIVSAVSTKFTTKDPQTPPSQYSNQKLDPEFNTQLKARRRKEKRDIQQSDSPPVPLQRARSRINFKVSPPKVRNFDREKENNKYLANRVSPRNRPWAGKTVLFPNPLFSSSSSSSQQQQFCKTRSPVISRKRGTATTKTTPPHKFVIKSSPPKATNFQVKVKNPHVVVSSISSPVRPTARLSSSKRWDASKLNRPFFPSKLASTASKSTKTIQKSEKGDKLVCLNKISPKRSAASKLCRSFSPSRLVTRLVSPLKSKKTVQKSDGLVSGLKQRPISVVQLPAPRFKNIL